MILLTIFLLLSLSVNIILFWYIRKLIIQLKFGLNFNQQLQDLLDEYAKSLEGMLELEIYYGDETITSAVKNTRMVIETCKIYEKSIFKKEDNVSEENETESSER